MKSDRKIERERKRKNEKRTGSQREISRRERQSLGLYQISNVFEQIQIVIPELIYILFVSPGQFSMLQR